MPKVNEIAKLQTAEQQKLISHIHQQAESSSKQVKHYAKSVNARREAQETAINEKQNEQGKNRGQKKKEEKSNDEKQQLQSSTKSLPSERHAIDIRL
jgi:hypothetical protein